MEASKGIYCFPANKTTRQNTPLPVLGPSFQGQLVLVPVLGSLTNMEVYYLMKPSESIPSHIFQI